MNNKCYNLINKNKNIYITHKTKTECFAILSFCHYNSLLSLMYRLFSIVIISCFLLFEHLVLR